MWVLLLFSFGERGSAWVIQKFNKSRREGYICSDDIVTKLILFKKDPEQKEYSAMAAFIVKVHNGQRDDELLNTSSEGTKKLVRSSSEKRLSLRLWYYFFQPFEMKPSAHDS